MPRPATSAVERVLSRIYRLQNGCWMWQGSLATGYGQIAVWDALRAKWRKDKCHRVMYEFFTGPIPRGMQLDHLCRNRACVRPGHLRVVTSRENSMAPGSLCVQKRNGEKTHCVRGHELSGANIKAQTVKGVVWRRCRTCINASQRKSAR